MAVEIREMSLEDYDQAMELWQSTEGIGLSSADARPSIAAFLERNPGLSFVAYENGSLVGTALAGHDGRRGYLYHLAVGPFQRRQGLGRLLVDHCLQSLREEGIGKCHLFVYDENQLGRDFWSATGWYERQELVIYSTDLA